MFCHLRRCKGGCDPPWRFQTKRRRASRKRPADCSRRALAIGGIIFGPWSIFDPVMTGQRSQIGNSMIFYIHEQTCAKVPKRFEILGSLSPRSGTLMDLGPCTSFLPWDSGNPGPQNFDSRKTLETQDLKIWICGETLETQDPEPQNFDFPRLKRPWSLHHSIQNFMLSIVPGSSTGDELGRSDSKNLNSKK